MIQSGHRHTLRESIWEERGSNVLAIKIDCSGEWNNMQWCKEDDPAGKKKSPIGKQNNVRNTQSYVGKDAFWSTDHLINSTLEPTRGYIQNGKTFSFYIYWLPIFKLLKDTENSMSHWNRSKHFWIGHISLTFLLLFCYKFYVSVIFVTLG